MFSFDDNFGSSAVTQTKPHSLFHGHAVQSSCGKLELRRGVFDLDVSWNLAYFILGVAHQSAESEPKHTFKGAFDRKGLDDMGLADISFATIANMIQTAHGGMDPALTLAMSLETDAKQHAAMESWLVDDSSADDSGAKAHLESGCLVVLNFEHVYFHKQVTFRLLPTSNGDLLRRKVALLETNIAALSEERSALADDLLQLKRAQFLAQLCTAPSVSRTEWRAPGSGSIVALTRGTIEGVYDYSTDAVDAIVLSTDTNCSLAGIGLLPAAGGCEALVAIYDGQRVEDAAIDGALDSDHLLRRFAPKLVKATEVSAANAEPIPFMFECPFELTAGALYTVALDQRNADGGASLRTKPDASGTVQNAGISLALTQSRHSTNGGTQQTGAFPCFYLSKLPREC